MPKIKTHKGAKARLDITGTGKIMRTKIGKSHFRRNKPKRVTRLFDEKIPVHPTRIKRVKRMLGI